VLPIVDVTKFTLQDFPNRTACIVWFGGCNFRCHYFHNPEFFIAEKCNFISEDDVFNFLESRKGLLDGVVLSGGEVCLSDIYDFVKRIKKMGFLIKIDTNGTNVNLLKKLINNSLVDFLALDYKSPEYKFYDVTGVNMYQKFRESLDFLVNNNNISMEVRTTVHTKLLNENDINIIIDDLERINYRDVYAIQNFRNNKTLKDIGEQQKILDINLIKKSQKIKIEYRNF
jgi:pyruvate formate lyase activating enzyme